MEALLEIGSKPADGCQVPAQFRLLHSRIRILKPLLIRLTFAAAAVASMGATYRSANFTVTAPTEEIAQQVARHAEHYRRELAVSWIGHELPNWYSPCPVTVNVGHMGAGGFTKFTFDRGATGEMEVFDWNMVVQGSLERILDSVIPHEVSHTILACHFRRPLPRWADEGAATLAEHESEQRRQLLMVKQILNTTQRIPLKQLLSMTEYPTDPQAVLSLYAQGYTLADMLVQKRGKAHYLKFLGESKKLGWDRVFRDYYGYQTLAALEQEWQGWIEKDCPRLDRDQPQLLAAAGRRRTPAKNVVIRSQTPEASESETEPAARHLPRKKRRLEAPRPKIVARPSTGKQKVALNHESGKSLRNSDARSRNEGWISIRTSGRAVSAMATSIRSRDDVGKNRRGQLSAVRERSRPRRLRRSLTLPAESGMAESWPAGVSPSPAKPPQSRIPANRRPAQRSESPRRTSEVPPGSDG